MSTASPDNLPLSSRRSAGDGDPRPGDAAFAALAYAAETLIQVGTRATPYVSTLDLASRTDLRTRSR